MQFQVPQNITMEDRIAGPFTAIQFGILVIGGGISFFAATSLGLPSPINNVVGFLGAIVTFFFAVGKFNDQPMYNFIKYVVAFLLSPRIRVWHKKGTDVKVVSPSHKIKDEELRHAPKNISKKDIARLAVVLDSRGAVGVPPKVANSQSSSPNDG